MRTLLILPLVLGVFLLIPSYNTAYGGTTPAITTWVGAGDGQSWSDPLNWDRQDVGPVSISNTFNHALPEVCDLVIIDDGLSAVTVHFNLLSFQLGNEMQIGLDDTLIIDSGSTFNHTPELFCPTLNAAAETIINNGNFNVFGTLINNVAFINLGSVLDCGIISGTSLPIPGIVNQCTVGGELIPIDTTALILAGAQSNTAWMIPVIMASIGIGIVIARKF